MSDLGRSSNHYRRMRKLAGLFDEVLRESLDGETSDAATELGELLIRLSHEKCQSYTEVLLLSVTCDWLGLGSKTLGDIGRELSSGSVGEDGRSVLMQISESLHNESACALSRLRSRL